MLDVIFDVNGSALAAIAVTIALLWLPGAVIAGLAGVRGWLLAGVAPAVSMGLVAVAAPLASGLGLGWDIVVYLGFGALVALLTAGGVVLARRRGLVLTTTLTPWSRTGTIAVAAAVVVAAVVAVNVIIVATHGLGSVPVGWDSPYHATAIRLIGTTGESGTRMLGWIDFPDKPGGSFYPYAYHCFEALVYQTTGADIPRVMNTGMAVTTTLVVPLGAVAFVRAVGGGAGFAAAAALVSTSFANYPWDLYQWGQLFPYAAGLSLVLPFLALLVHWFRGGADRAGPLVAFAGVGLTGTHSAMIFVSAIFGACFAVHRLVEDRRRFLRGDLPRLGLAAAGVGLLALPYLLGALTMAGMTAAYDWPAVTSPSKALGDGLLLGSDSSWPQWLLACFMVLGVLLMLRNDLLRWVAAGWLVFLFLFVVASGVDFPWAQAITSPWWNDRFRLVSAMILPATIAAGWGMWSTVRWLTERVSRVVRLRPERTAFAALGVVAVLVAAVFLVQTKGGYVQRNAERLWWTYGSNVLSVREQEGMREIRKIVKPDEMVMNDGGDGTVWMYALTGVRPVINHYLLNPTSERRQLLLDDFDHLSDDPAVAKVIRDLNIRYVAVSTGYIGGFRRAPGLTNLDGLPALSLRYANPDFQLYAIDWSKLADGDGN
ncbi:hypothetical protein GCM10022243_63800 [Saccharothrix violaceirubra]|uniref:Uncharacterized protein n=1 Tax=Saccharothrix violaceirubra TaxID=413306 RepID=A0A7W7TCA3_9PSEU|nr:DUF6541 family protein [Saccharothrix violaceirubra]MBB4969135.1 hypothetical protein [Saccharothrix violaceirubra]